MRLNTGWWCSELNPGGQIGGAIALVVLPWWSTWWFRGLTLALAAACAAGLYAWRVKSLERRRRTLEAEIAERRQVEDALRASNREIQHLAGRLINAQEAERTRIARDLHDGVCQDVAAISVDLCHLRQNAGDVQASEVQAMLLSLQNRTASVAETLRRLSHGLHPSVLNHIGLVAALHAHCAEVERQHRVRVKFFADGDVEPASGLVALSLFRIAQEALRNGAIHGHASHASVSLTRKDAELTLAVADDGEGFDPVAARERSGLGLVSIEERARVMKGVATIRSEPGRGTTVEVRVPVEAVDQARGRENAMLIEPVRLKRTG
jgi:signal transduction histidine kinase